MSKTDKPTCKIGFIPKSSFLEKSHLEKECSDASDTSLSVVSSSSASERGTSTPKSGKKKMSEMTEEEQYRVAEELVDAVIQPSLDLHINFIRQGLI